MILLLDTHTFIWWESDSGQLSSLALALCRDRGNALWLSVASVWEMQIKLQLGKLRLAYPLTAIIDRQQPTNNLRVLEIRLEHVLAVDRLPSIHRDPFDRLLMAQAQVEQMPILSVDTVFDRYPVSCLW